MLFILTKQDRDVYASFNSEKRMQIVDPRGLINDKKSDMKGFINSLNEKHDKELFYQKSCLHHFYKNTNYDNNIDKINSREVLYKYFIFYLDMNNDNP